jgi:hypothetical protein
MAARALAFRKLPLRGFPSGPAYGMPRQPRLIGELAMRAQRLISKTMMITTRHHGRGRSRAA